MPKRTDISKAIAVLGAVACFLQVTALPASACVEVHKRFKVRAIQGAVVDPDHKPVSGAKVTLYAGSGKSRTKVAALQTDDVGHFFFGNQESGDYEVTVEAAGFAPGFAVLRLTGPKRNWRKGIFVIVSPGGGCGTGNREYIGTLAE